MKKILIYLTFLFSIFLYANENDDISNIINNSLSNYIDNDREITNIINDTLGNKIDLISSTDNNLSKLDKGSKQFSELEKYENEELDINNPEDIYNLARVYAKNGYFESAYRVANLDKTGNVKNLYISATAARMIGDYDNSIKNYLKVLDINQYHIKSILGLGLAYRSKGDYQRALTYLVAFNNLFPSTSVSNLITELNSK